MKNLARTILFTAACFISLQLQSQSTNIFAGYNSSNFALKVDSIDNSSISPMPGFHIGTNFNFKINGILTFQPGITFQRKGFRSEINNAGESHSKTQFELYYLDVPLNLKTQFAIAEKLNVFVTAGPYLGLGLFGTIETESNSPLSKQTDKNQVEWGRDLQQINLGLSLGLGLNYQRFLLGWSYDIGLSNLNLANSTSNSARNRVLRISLGYKLDI